MAVAGPVGLERLSRGSVVVVTATHQGRELQQQQRSRRAGDESGRDLQEPDARMGQEA
ncbi:MAG TPA: hypothetical protein VGV57_07705 [Thermoleophilaceae bacterium]|nr:hypothetical protein [Thermoleophilaceae bacterium]